MFAQGVNKLIANKSREAWLEYAEKSLGKKPHEAMSYIGEAVCSIEIRIEENARQGGRTMTTMNVFSVPQPMLLMQAIMDDLIVKGFAVRKITEHENRLELQVSW